MKKIPGSAEVHFTSHNTTGDLIQSCAASLRLATEFVADLRSAYLARKRLAFLLRKNRENSRKITSGALLCSSSFSQLHSVLAASLRLATEFVADLRSAYLARKSSHFCYRKNHRNSPINMLH